MATLGEIRSYGACLTIYCNTVRPEYCGNSWSPSMDQLVQYFGVDFDPVENRPVFLRRFVCEKCRQRNITTIWQPARGYMENMASHNHGPPDPEEMARLRADYARDSAIYEARQAEFERMRREDKAEAKARRKQQRDIESGRDIIGPPSPWAGRKRGRWL